MGCLVELMEKSRQAAAMARLLGRTNRICVRRLLLANYTTKETALASGIMDGRIRKETPQAGLFLVLGRGCPASGFVVDGSKVGAL